MKALLLAVFTLVTFTAQPPLPALPNSAEVQLKVERDGSLSVIEAISVPSDTTMTRTIPLRTAAAHNRDRIYGVRGVTLEGAGETELTADAFTIRLRGGTSVVRYTVDGVVHADAGVLRVSWQLAGGWDAPLNLVRATFAAPRISSAVTCSAAGHPCGAAQIDHSGLTRFSQQNLPAGQPMDITVELPPGTVPVTQRLVPAKTFAGGFVLSTPVGWAWGGFGLVAVVAAAALWRARRRAARPGDPLPTATFTGAGDEVAFASPDGVLPGHTGTVLAGRADAVDLAATVLDLAVRNYLWVSEAEPGWLLTRRNQADEQLTEFERAVFGAILPDGTESILLAELRAQGISVDAVRPELYADLVRRKWFSQRPDQRAGKLRRAGVRMIFYGAFVAVLLALTVGYAQLGVMLAIAGGLLAIGARWLPVATGRGLLLRRRLLGLAAQLRETQPKRIPKPARDLVFSRALPYALALGELDRWVGAFAEMKWQPSCYWYEGEAAPRRVSEFTVALVGTFAGTRLGRVR